VFEFDKDKFRSRFEDVVTTLYRIRPEDATDEQKYYALSAVVQHYITRKWLETHERFQEEDSRKLYYLSMEFLEGRALGNNLINICQDKRVREFLDEMGISLNTLEDQERDPALGNGGLGRLAACFLDSLATLSYPAYGCGIRYKYGLFRQKIVDGFQVELPDNWLKNGYPFEIRRTEYTCEVKFGGYVETNWDGERNHFVLKNYDSVQAVPYDIPIVGYGNDFVNTLRVWDAEPYESLDLDEFQKGNYNGAREKVNFVNSITDVLYPNDSNRFGKELRLRQQYFFVSASVQTAIKKYMQHHDDIRGIRDKIVFHMNDTHPVLAIPELMRILLDEYGLDWAEAWSLTTSCCAFTNHTIMSEALEKWPRDIMEEMLPRIWQIISEIDRRSKVAIKERYGEDQGKMYGMAVIWDDSVRMANLAITGSYSVNGVAAIHTEILKKEVFRDFYEMTPEKFSNKTNGVTQRRFLLSANPLLAEWITDRIGSGWITDLTQLAGLKHLADDENALKELAAIKKKNKERLAEYIYKNNGILVNTDSIFDVQVKRLHEYKRQLMNILHIMHLYNRLKDEPNLDIVPHTFIFGAKAAPAYSRAKLTIKLINAVADVVNNDAAIAEKLKIVFIEDYCVSNAELIFPAAEISEQISAASKEASGTSNMKFMMNGALTLGTMDGANVEIVEEVGRENAFIFGMSAEEVISHEKAMDYSPGDIIRQDPSIRRMLLQLVNGFYSGDKPELFRDIYQSLVPVNDQDGADRFFILKDFSDYIRAHEEADRRYRNASDWNRASLLNIAGSGRFSSDRTIEDYVRDIWHLKKLNTRQ